MQQSTRKEMTYENFSHNSGNPMYIISTILPITAELENIDNGTANVESYYYFGSLPIVFFFVAIFNKCEKNKKREIIKWTIIAILFYILSLGHHTFLHKILYNVPLINKLQRSCNFMLMLHLRYV